MNMQDFRFSQHRHLPITLMLWCRSWFSVNRLLACWHFDQHVTMAHKQTEQHRPTYCLLSDIVVGTAVLKTIALWQQITCYNCRLLKAKIGPMLESVNHEKQWGRIWKVLSLAPLVFWHLVLAYFCA
jgi:hypothetical protein